MSFRRLDDWCLAEAVRRAAMQPRMDNTIGQLPSGGTADPTDLLVIERNGENFNIAVSTIPTSAINPPYYYNVKTYGAVGDGVTVNDSAFLATATAAAATGGAIFIPFGNYLVSNTFTWTTGANVSILGTGPGASIITRAGGAIGPTLISTASGASFVTISNIGFTGNGVNPTPSPNAPTVIVINGGVANRVVNCYFTGNTGDCIDFLGVTGGEITACRFNATGYNAAGTSLANQCPAILFDTNTIGSKCHHNDFIGVKYFGGLILGTNCEFSYNYLKNSGNAGLRVNNGGSTYGLGNGTRIVGNEFDTTFQNPIDGLGGNAIYCNHVQNIVAMANIISTCDADGFVMAGCQNSTVVNNIAYNCAQRGNNCGFQFNPQSGVTNTGMTYVGNVSYDSQVTPTQLNGMRILGPGSNSTYAVVVGNNFNNFTGTVGINTQRGINMNDGVMDDDTNIIAYNNDVLDRQHLNASTVVVPQNTTASAVGTPSGSVLKQFTVEKGTLGQNRAMSFVAYGTTTVATGITLYVSFGSVSLGNFVTWSTSSAHTGVEWKIVGNFNNASNGGVQHFTFDVYYNGALATSGYGSLSVDTTTDQVLVFQATTGAGDSVTVGGCTLLRA